MGVFRVLELKRRYRLKIQASRVNKDEEHYLMVKEEKVGGLF